MPAAVQQPCWPAEPWLTGEVGPLSKAWFVGEASFLSICLRTRRTALPCIPTLLVRLLLGTDDRKEARLAGEPGLRSWCARGSRAATPPGPSDQRGPQWQLWHCRTRASGAPASSSSREQPSLTAALDAVRRFFLPMAADAVQFVFLAVSPRCECAEGLRNGDGCVATASRRPRRGAAFGELAVRRRGLGIRAIGPSLRSYGAKQQYALPSVDSRPDLQLRPEPVRPILCRAPAEVLDDCGLVDSVAAHRRSDSAVARED